MHPSDLRSQSDFSKLKVVHDPAVNHPQETIFARECSKKSHGKDCAPYRAGEDVPSVICGSYGRCEQILEQIVVSNPWLDSIRTYSVLQRI